MLPLLLLAIAAVHTGTLGGYVFRETDGNPPRRAMTVDLCEGDRSRYHATTQPDGRFLFPKVQEGQYVLRVRFGEFVVVADPVSVASTRTNFAAVMLPKRRVTARDFRAVTANQLASQSNGKLQKKLREATRLVIRRDLPEAARIYEEVVAANATAELLDRLALLYQQVGKKDDAVRTFEKAIGLDPEYLQPYVHLGWLFQQERRYGDLLKLAGRAITVDPGWMTAHTLLGAARAGVGDSGAALLSFERASELVQRKAAEPYLLMAQIRYLLRDCTGARKDLERYFELSTSARELRSTADLLQLLNNCAPAAGPLFSPGRGKSPGRIAD